MRVLSPMAALMTGNARRRATMSGTAIVGLLFLSAIGTDASERPASRQGLDLKVARLAVNGRLQIANDGPPSVAATEGVLRVPPGYREKYEYMGSWSVAGDNGAKEMHIVYASPGAIAGYDKAGHFPDGAVLVKEATKVRPRI
jgi:Cytochrome P460